MENMTDSTDTQLARFDEQLKALRREVTDGFKNINDNLLGRINDLSTTKLPVSDFVNFRNELVTLNDTQNKINSDYEARMRISEKFISNITGKYAVWAVVGGMIITMLTGVGTALVIKSFQSKSSTIVCVQDNCQK